MSPEDRLRYYMSGNTPPDGAGGSPPPPDRPAADGAAADAADQPVGPSRREKRLAKRERKQGAIDEAHRQFWEPKLETREELLHGRNEQPGDIPPRTPEQAAKDEAWRRVWAPTSEEKEADRRAEAARRAAEAEAREAARRAEEARAAVEAAEQAAEQAAAQEREAAAQTEAQRRRREAEEMALDYQSRLQREVNGPLRGIAVVPIQEPANDYLTEALIQRFGFVEQEKLVRRSQMPITRPAVGAMAPFQRALRRFQRIPASGEPTRQKAVIRYFRSTIDQTVVMKQTSHTQMASRNAVDGRKARDLVPISAELISVRQSVADPRLERAKDEAYGLNKNGVLERTELFQKYWEMPETGRDAYVQPGLPPVQNVNLPPTGPVREGGFDMHAVRPGAGRKSSVYEAEDRELHRGGGHGAGHGEGHGDEHHDAGAPGHGPADAHHEPAAEHHEPVSEEPAHPPGWVPSERVADAEGEVFEAELVPMPDEPETPDDADIIDAEFVDSSSVPLAIEGGAGSPAATPEPDATPPPARTSRLTYERVAAAEKAAAEAERRAASRPQPQPRVELSDAERAQKIAAQKEMRRTRHVDRMAAALPPDIGPRATDAEMAENILGDRRVLDAPTRVMPGPEPAPATPEAAGAEEVRGRHAGPELPEPTAGPGPTAGEGGGRHAAVEETEARHAAPGDSVGRHAEPEVPSEPTPSAELPAEADGKSAAEEPALPAPVEPGEAAPQVETPAVPAEADTEQAAKAPERLPADPAMSNDLIFQQVVEQAGPDFGLPRAGQVTIPQAQKMLGVATSFGQVRAIESDIRRRAAEGRSDRIKRAQRDHKIIDASVEGPTRTDKDLLRMVRDKETQLNERDKAEQMERDRQRQSERAKPEAPQTEAPQEGPKPEEAVDPGRQELAEKLSEARTSGELKQAADQAVRLGFVELDDKGVPHDIAESGFAEPLREVAADIESYQALRRYLANVESEPGSELEKVKTAYASEQAHETEFEWTPEAVEAVLGANPPETAKRNLQRQLIASGDLIANEAAPDEKGDLTYIGRNVRLEPANEAGAKALGVEFEAPVEAAEDVPELSADERAAIGADIIRNMINANRNRRLTDAEWEAQLRAEADRAVEPGVGLAQASDNPRAPFGIESTGSRESEAFMQGINQLFQQAAAREESDEGGDDGDNGGTDSRSRRAQGARRRARQSQERARNSARRRNENPEG